PGKKFCISQVLQDVAVVSENQNNNWINQEKNGPLCLEIHFESFRVLNQRHDLLERGKEKSEANAVLVVFTFSSRPAVRKIRAPEALVPTTASAAPTAVPCESFPRESLSSELLISARPSSLLPREA
ncbi:hypothetical protein V1477_003049, partial [Vespula maculifrons]